jgi:hypothetical protein
MKEEEKVEEKRPAEGEIKKRGRASTHRRIDPGLQTWG